mgnify:CR=1 FL=1
MTRVSAPAEKDVGLGTAYERWAIYSCLETLCHELDVKSAMEGPYDGMAGIPGVHLLTQAHKGVDVLAVHENDAGADQIRAVYAAHKLTHRLKCQVSSLPPKDCGVDLVFSFNALPLVEDWRAYVAALFSTGAKYVVLAVTNPVSYGVYLRKALRVLEPSSNEPELFDHEATKGDALTRELKRHGKILRHEYLDCPWWPDLFVSTGQSLLSGTLKRFGLTRKKQAPKSFIYGLNSFPYQNADGAKELINAMKKHPGFEDAPHAIARIFGHHQLFVVAPAS